MASDLDFEAARPLDLPVPDGGPEASSQVSFVHFEGNTDTDLHYDVGRILLADETSTSAIILQNESLFCAVPFESWNRKVSSGLLPPRAISRPGCCVLSQHAIQLDCK